MKYVHGKALPSLKPKFPEQYLIKFMDHIKEDTSAIFFLITGTVNQKNQYMDC